MEPHIRSLVRYQELNLEIASLDVRLAAIPGELQAIDRRQEQAAAVIKEARQRHEESLKERRSQERDLKELEQKVDKYNDQSREVKTNEQYRAIMNEIQAVKTRIGEVEEKILLAMEAADALERKIGQTEREVAGRKKEFDDARKLLTEERERVSARRSELDADRRSVAAAVPPPVMDTYARVVKLRGDLALAAIRDERCTACNVRLRPALVAEVRKNEALLQCESCRRLLYLFPDAASRAADGGAEGAEGRAAQDPIASGGRAAPGDAISPRDSASSTAGARAPDGAGAAGTPPPETAAS